MAHFFRSGSGQGQPLPPDPRRTGYDRVPPRNALIPDDYEKRPSGGYSPEPSRRSAGGRRYAVVECPSPQLALSNCAIVHRGDFPAGQAVLVKGNFPLTVRHDDTGKLAPGCIGASSFQRQWIGLSASGDEVDIQTLNLSSSDYLTSLDIEIGFWKRGHEVAEQYDPDEMMRNFIKAFNGQIFAVGQILVFDFHGQNLKGVVRGMQLVELPNQKGGGGAAMGLLMDKTDITFMKAPDSAIKMKSSTRKPAANSIIAPNFKFEDMGIGGLDSEFGVIFRRAFASRVFPPGLVDKLGIQHVKGIILFGPPGTGKTLMARQIGKMLNAKEPKIVNGPEILNKFYKAKGDESDLHIIIFDELDAICKQRGSTGGGTGVGDSVVNQLLSKMDGVDQLNNILIIGMTNRLDMIDEALLRPGRLEVQMEISLPDEKGRLQILTIHTAKMRANHVMERDVNLAELAAVTKNFSGAEISGLVKSATSYAFNRHVKIGTMAGISDDVENLRVNREDFLMALDEVHPMFGVSEEELQAVVQNGIIHYDATVDNILHDGQLFVDQVRTSMRTPLVTLLLHGPSGSGKTALAATIAQASQFPFIKLLSPDGMVGFSEAAKMSAITKVFTDSYKSPLSVIVVDNLERLLDWVPIGPRFSNGVLQTLMVLFARRPPKGRRLLIIATTGIRAMLTEMQMSEVFDSQIRVPPISNLRSLEIVLKEVELFRASEDRKRAMGMLEQAGFGNDGRLNVGVKKLLSVIEMARQEPEEVSERLVTALMGLDSL
ncbi:transport between ER and Golgi ATPase protein [Tulasnella sp. 332]|nr:transport between ER and Golgi ATPase protein [Tulasnella sp. 332]